MIWSFLESFYSLFIKFIKLSSALRSVLSRTRHKLHLLWPAIPSRTESSPSSRLNLLNDWTILLFSWELLKKISCQSIFCLSKYQIIGCYWFGKVFCCSGISSPERTLKWVQIIWFEGIPSSDPSFLIFQFDFLQLLLQQSISFFLGCAYDSASGVINPSYLLNHNLLGLESVPNGIGSHKIYSIKH